MNLRAVIAWNEAIDDYLAMLTATNASPHTIRLRRFYLRGLRDVCAIGYVGPWDASRHQIVTFMGNAKWAPETRKAARSSARSFYTWAEDEGRISLSPARRLPSVRVPDAVPKPTPDAAFDAALKAAGERDRLMLLLGAWCGLRRAEIAAVHAEDIVPDELRVIGKGGRKRVVPLEPTFAAELRDAAAGGWLFPGQHQGHLAPNYVGIILKRLLGPDWSCHTLRHRFATRAYAAERDLRAVQTLLGHSKPETTARYTAIPDGALRAAVAAAVR